MPELKKIGFIGTGIMGAAMAGHLMDAGYELTVYNRTKAKAESLIARGAHWAESADACAEGQDVVISIVGYPKDVEETYFGKEGAEPGSAGADGVLAHAKKGAYLIDMTTSAPSLAVRIYEAAKERGLHAMDAPVTGGDTGAKAGTLTILAGGDEADFQALTPVFEAMGKTIVYEGKAGNGQHVKMCNQIAIAGALSGACEAIAYARAAGLDAEKMLATIATGAAGSFQLSNVAKKGMEGNFAPGFMLKHFVKDMGLAYEAAEENGADLEILCHVLKLCRALEDAGLGDEGTQALLKHYEKNTGKGKN